MHIVLKKQKKEKRKKEKRKQYGMYKTAVRRIRSEKMAIEKKRRTENEKGIVPDR
jgi:hypothetical protein